MSFSRRSGHTQNKYVSLSMPVQSSLPFKVLPSNCINACSVLHPFIVLPSNGEFLWLDMSIDDTFLSHKCTRVSLTFVSASPHQYNNSVEL